MRRRRLTGSRSTMAVLVSLTLVILSSAAAVAIAVPVLTADPSAPDGNNGWYRAVPTVTLAPPLGGSSILYQWLPAGPVTTYFAPFALGAPQYGTHTLRYGYGVAPDSFDDSATAEFKVDPIAPNVTGVVEARGLPATTWHRSVDATFTWGSDESLSGVAGFSFVFAQTLPPVDTTIDTAATTLVENDLYTGRWYFRIRATDMAGNWGPVTTREHLVDNTPPSVSADAVSAYEDVAVISVVAADGHAGLGQVETSVDAGGYSPVSTRTITGIGPHTFRYRATDVVGNVSSEGTADFSIVPGQPPTTTISGVDSLWHNTDVFFQLDATDEVSGVYRTYYRIGTGPTTEYAAAPVRIADEGANTVSYWSVDNAGNSETTKTATVYIDKSGPSVVIDSPPVTEGTATVSYQLEDAYSGLLGDPLVLVDGVQWTGGRPLLVDAVGSHTVMVFATDAAGNDNWAIAGVDVVASEAPVTEISGLVGTWVPEAAFELAANDNHSGVASMHFRLGDGADQEYFSPVVISAEGTTAVRYWSVDGAGNIEPANGPAYAYVDHSSPVTTAGLSASTVGTATVVLASSDAFAGVGRVTYRLDSHDATTYARPIVTVVKGMHVLQYSATDAIGNQETTRTLVFSVGRVPTTLSGRTSSARALYGSMVGVSGVLKSSDGIVVAGSRNVSLWASVAGGAWTRIGPATYDPGTKSYRASRRILANQRLQLRFAGDANNKASASAPVSVACAVTISRPITPWTNGVGRPIVVYGTLFPKHAAGSTVATLNCYRLEGERWVLRKTASARAYDARTYTKYAALVTLPTRGRWKIVAVHSDALHARTVSPARILLVR